jgi:hypothetical protein
VVKPVSALEAIEFAEPPVLVFAVVAQLKVLAPPLVTFKFVRFQVLTTGA